MKAINYFCIRFFTPTESVENLAIRLLLTVSIWIFPWNWRRICLHDMTTDCTYSFILLQFLPRELGQKFFALILFNKLEPCSMILKHSPPSSLQIHSDIFFIFIKTSVHQKRQIKKKTE